MITRAISKYEAVYSEVTPQMNQFIDWAQKHFKREESAI